MDPFISIDFFQAGSTFFQVLILKSSLVALLAWITACAFRRSSASIRYAIWATALICLAILLPFNHLLPTWSQGLVVIPIQEATVTKADFASKSPTGVYYKQSQPLRESKHPLPVSGPTQDIHIEESTSLGSLFTVRTIFFIGACIWLLGVLVSLFNLFVHAYLTRRIARLAYQPAHIEELYQPIARRSKRVRILLSAQINMPMTWGLRNPVIIMPEEALHWPPSRYKSVLMHEYAHVIRRDYAMFIVAQLVCALYWFNPLVSIARRNLLLEQERACDDYVLSKGIQPQEYASHLLEVARIVRQKGTLLRFSVAAANRSTLKERLTAILDRSSNREGLTWAKGAVLVGLLMFAMLPLLTMTAWRTELRSNDSASQEWIMQLDAESASDRQKAAWALGELEDKNGVDALIQQLSDQDPGARGMAAWALGEIKDLRAVPALLNALTDPDAYDKERIVIALGELEDTRATSSLITILNEEALPLQEAAAWALGEIKSQSAIEALAQSIPVSSTALRVAIVEALGNSRRPGALSSLKSALHDIEPQVRQAAVKSIQKIPSPTSAQVLTESLAHHEDPAVRASSATALRYFIGSVVDQSLIHALDDEVPSVRAQSAMVLGQRGTEGAIDALIQHVRDADHTVRSNAAWALDEINLD